MMRISSYTHQSPTNFLCLTLVCSYACLFVCLTDGSGSLHVVESPLLLSEQSLLLDLQAGLISGWSRIHLPHLFTRLAICQKSTQASIYTHASASYIPSLCDQQGKQQSCMR